MQTSTFASILALVASVHAYPQGSDTQPYDVELVTFIQAVLPSASITFVSPAQSTALVGAADAYAKSFVENPSVVSVGSSVMAQIGSSLSTTLPADVLTSVLENAEDSFYANPTAFLGTVVNAQVTGIPSAKDAVNKVQEEFFNGLKSVAAKELSVPANPGATPGAKAASVTGVTTSATGTPSPAPATTTGSKNAAAMPTAGAQVYIGALAAVAGVAAML